MTLIGVMITNTMISLDITHILEDITFFIVPVMIGLWCLELFQSDIIMNAKTKLTLADAAVVAGKSTNTLNRAKNSGKISVEIIDKVAYYDVAELARVYPKTFDFNRLDKSESNSNSPSLNRPETKSVSSAEIKILEERLNSANKLIEKDKEERIRERNQLEDRITKLETALEKSQNHETRLIEYQKSKEGEGTNFEQILKPIQDEISNLKKTSEEDRAKMSDLGKANMMYKFTGVVLTMMAIGTTIYVMIEKGIIQLN